MKCYLCKHDFKLDDRDKSFQKRNPGVQLMCQQCRNEFMGMCKVFPLGVMDKFLKMKEAYNNG